MPASVLQHLRSVKISVARKPRLTLPPELATEIGLTETRRVLNGPA